jgi:O-antigen/teichoic acid export membrane protein
MVILAQHPPIVSITIVLGAAIAASDRQKAWLLVGVVAVIVNIGLNLAAIPWTVHRYHNGAIGAATITVVTEMAIMIAR